ncbi:MAG TPA: hypothetical protein VGC67_07770 [Cellulomonas sp.]
MSLFRRRPRVAAELPTGFHAGEALALQASVLSALTAVERATGGPVPVLLEVDAGRPPRLVLVCRNLVVGFVPEACAGPLDAQRTAAGRARLVVPGLLHRDERLWRVWAGPVPAEGLPAVPPGTDTLAAAPVTVLGIPLGRPAGE